MGDTRGCGSEGLSPDLKEWSVQKRFKRKHNFRKATTVYALVAKEHRGGSSCFGGDGQGIFTMIIIDSL